MRRWRDGRNPMAKQPCSISTTLDLKSSRWMDPRWPSNPMPLAGLPQSAAARQNGPRPRDRRAKLPSISSPKAPVRKRRIHPFERGAHRQLAVMTPGSLPRRRRLAPHLPILVCIVTLIGDSPQPQVLRPEPAAAILQDLRSFANWQPPVHRGPSRRREHAAHRLLIARRHYRTAYLSLTPRDGGKTCSVLNSARTGGHPHPGMLAARRVIAGILLRAIDSVFQGLPRDSPFWDERQVLGDMSVIRCIAPIAHHPFSTVPRHAWPPHGVSRARAGGIQTRRDPKHPEQLATLAPWQPTAFCGTPGVRTVSRPPLKPDLLRSTPRQ